MSGTFPGTPVKNCDKARDAFASRDATASKIEHAKKITSTLEPWSEKTPDTVRVLYMSGIEGVSLTLAVVASAAGIGDGASWPTVVVIAAVVVVATGLASGFGEFVNSMGELLLARWSANARPGRWRTTSTASVARWWQSTWRADTQNTTRN